MIFRIKVNAPIAGRNLGSENDMVYVYTLPTCPICEMVKRKLKDKNIQYEEKPFEEGNFNTDRAPVVFTGETYLMSPVAINNWIKEA